MNKRFHVLDGFRGIFAIIVALYHFKPGPGSLGNYLLISNGWLFVDFFFVLSGFVIYYNYSGITTLGEQKTFLIKRFIRLYPLHFCLLIIFLLFETAKAFLFSYGLFNKPAFDEQNIVSFGANIFLIQAYGIPLPELKHLTWNASSWSISAEIFSYLLFCLTIVYINQLSRSFQIVIYVLISGASIVLLYFINDNSFSLMLGAHFGILRCSYSFFLGCVVCVLYISLMNKYYSLIMNRKGSFLIFSFLEILSFTSALLCICYLPLKATFLVPIFFFVCILIYSFEAGCVSAVIKGKIFNKLGVLSYSIYMVNEIVQIMFDIFFLRILKVKNAFLYDSTAIVYVVFIILLSEVTYRNFEVKGRKALEWIIYKRKLNVTQNN